MWTALSSKHLTASFAVGCIHPLKSSVPTTVQRLLVAYPAKTAYLNNTRKIDHIQKPKAVVKAEAIEAATTVIVLLLLLVTLCHNYWLLSHISWILQICLLTKTVCIYE